MHDLTLTALKPCTHSNVLRVSRRGGVAQAESTAETEELQTCLFLALEGTTVVCKAQERCRAYLVLTVRLDRQCPSNALEGHSAL